MVDWNTSVMSYTNIWCIRFIDSVNESQYSMAPKLYEKTTKMLTLPHSENRCFFGYILSNNKLWVKYRVCKVWISTINKKKNIQIPSTQCIKNIWHFQFHQYSPKLFKSLMWMMHVKVTLTAHAYVLYSHSQSEMSIQNS